MEYEALREYMVETQLLPRGIHDQRVLDAFRKVPRHEFVPEEFRKNAYEDYPLPIGKEQTISQPYIVALMTQLLCLTGEETVLEIGTGSGYQTAILAELAQNVFTVERIAALSENAKQVFKALSYQNITCKVGDGTEGWKDKSPFNRIMVTAAGDRIPEPLIEQLADGGKLVMPVGTYFGQMLTVAEKRGTRISTQGVCGCVFVPLVGKYA